MEKQGSIDSSHIAIAHRLTTVGHQDLRARGPYQCHLRHAAVSTCSSLPPNYRTRREQLYPLLCDLQVFELAKWISGPQEYFALLSVADLAVITSVRDGMNTTSMEYTICQKEFKNPLILSEFTGVTGSMKAAIKVNPWDLGVSVPVYVVLISFSR